MSKKGENKFLYQLQHVFKNRFIDVAIAFWCKYKEKNSYNTITIADVKQVGDNKFSFVRRMDGDGKIEYEIIRYERQKQKIVADLFLSEDKKRNLAERCEYLHNSVKGGVEYRLSVFKENWCKFIRTRAFNWGIGKMEDTLQKIQEQQKNAKPASL